MQFLLLFTLNHCVTHDCYVIKLQDDKFYDKKNILIWSIYKLFCMRKEYQFTSIFDKYFLDCREKTITKTYFECILGLLIEKIFEINYKSIEIQSMFKKLLKEKKKEILEIVQIKEFNTIFSFIIPDKNLLPAIKETIIICTMHIFLSFIEKDDKIFNDENIILNLLDNTAEGMYWNILSIDNFVYMKQSDLNMIKHTFENKYDNICSKNFNIEKNCQFLYMNILDFYVQCFTKKFTNNLKENFNLTTDSDYKKYKLSINKKIETLNKYILNKIENIWMAINKTDELSFIKNINYFYREDTDQMSLMLLGYFNHILLPQNQYICVFVEIIKENVIYLYHFFQQLVVARQKDTKKIYIYRYELI